MGMLTKSNITLAPMPQSAGLLPMIAPLVERGLEYEHGEHSVHDVLTGIFDGSFQLWVVTAPATDEVLSIGVTALADFPQKRILELFLVAGKRLDMWLDHIRILEEFALSQGALALEWRGRRGWEKVMKNFGYSPKCVVMYKELDRNGRKIEANYSCH